MRKKAMIALTGVMALMVSLLVPALFANSSQAIATPIKAAFYYGWFPETWHSNDKYSPSLGQYTSDNVDTMSKHINAMQYAGLNAAVYSWWGDSHANSDGFYSFLGVADAYQFNVIPYYEKEYGTTATDPSEATITNDLDSLGDQANEIGSFATIGTKPIIIVYNSGDTGCSDVTKWKNAEAASNYDFYVNMKVFPGFDTCADQPDAWHQYGPDTARHDFSDVGSFTISPGFNHHNESSPRLARDLNRWTTDIQAMKATNADFQLVSSFNEWGEGTSIESSPSWSSASGYGTYIDALRNELVTSVPATNDYTVTDDAYVQADTATTNYGSNVSLMVDASPVKNAYVQVSVPSGNNAVTSAQLKVYANSALSGGLTVHKVRDQNWGESSINYNNAPAADVTTLASRDTAITAGTWVTFDIPGWAVNPGLNSFVIKSSNNTNLNLSSSEGANAPKLTVNFGTGGGADTTPPETTITSAPSATTTSTSASFSFNSNEAGTFECKLDAGSYSACTSPKAYSGLSVGAHTFSVRAIDNANLTDPTPATHDWTITTAPTNETVTPTADAYVQSDTPTTNYNGSSLQVDGTPVKKAYLKFSAAVAPVSATLRVYANSTHSSGFGVAKSTDNSWTETGINHDNAPTFGAQGATSGPLTVGTWKEVDVTSMISSGTNTLVLKDVGSSTNMNMSSKEGANPPQLVLVYENGPDNDPPETTITSSPASSTTSTSATFNFTSDESPSTFECKLDSGAYSSCTSPKSYSGLAVGSHTFSVKAKDGAGNEDPTPASFTWTITASGGSSTVVWAVGDICDDDNKTELSESCGHNGTMIAADTALDWFLPLGDIQYENGAPSDFANFYNPKMGKLVNLARAAGGTLFDVTIPVPGNHEYNCKPTGSGSSDHCKNVNQVDEGVPYRAYGYYDYFGTKAGDPTKGYYAKDLGKWTVIVLNSANGDTFQNASSAQYAFASAEMDAANAEGDNIIAALHHPPYSDGSNYSPGCGLGGSCGTQVHPLFDLAFDKGVDLFLAGHDHQYQNWGKISKSGTQLSSGIPYWVSGTGGKANNACNVSAHSPNGNMCYGGSGTPVGALRLVLKDTSFDFQFKTVDGQTRDSGTITTR